MLTYFVLFCVLFRFSFFYNFMIDDVIKSCLYESRNEVNGSINEIRRLQSFFTNGATFIWRQAIFHSIFYSHFSSTSVRFVENFTYIITINSGHFHQLTRNKLQDKLWVVLLLIKSKCSKTLVFLISQTKFMNTIK